MISIQQQKLLLRQFLKDSRSSLTAQERLEYSEKITQQICASDWLTRVSKVAAYVSFGAEVSTFVLLDQLMLKKISVYLPVIENKTSKSMNFALYTQQEDLHPNVFGILQPKKNPQAEINPRDFDVVLMPLLGFDEQGHRLGMGAGYYDRTFASCLSQSKKPLFVGLAFETQKVAQIPHEAHDILLDYVVTEKRIYDSHSRTLK